MAMAIEAVRLLTDPLGRSIKGYSLRNIYIIEALRIPHPSTGTKTQFQLRLCSKNNSDRNGGVDFSLYSVGGEDS